MSGPCELKGFLEDNLVVRLFAQSRSSRPVDKIVRRVCPRLSSALQSHGRCREGFDRPSATKRVRCRALRKKGARKVRRSFHPADPLPKKLGSRHFPPRPK